MHCTFNRVLKVECAFSPRASRSISLKVVVVVVVLLLLLVVVSVVTFCKNFQITVHTVGRCRWRI